MKKIYLLIITISVFFLFSCSQDKKVVIEIPEMSEATAYIIYQDPDMINARTQEEIAKTDIKNGRCEILLDSLQFDGDIKECTITIINQDKQFGANLPLPIQKGKTITLKITGVNDYLTKKSILNVSYSGSRFAEAFSTFWNKVNDSFLELNKNNNSIQTYKKQVALYKDFIKTYPKSGYVYSVLLGEMTMIQEDSNPIVEYCAELSNEKSDNIWHKYLSSAYKDRQLKQITSSTLVFSAKDKDGKTFTERDVKGKLILIDFWASWCKPCIESISKLKELYTKYKSKGLTIVSISVDTNPDDWFKYVEKNPFAWMSLLGNGQDITQRYNFQYIPYVLIADENGKILQKGIEIDKLESFINRYLNN